MNAATAGRRARRVAPAPELVVVKHARRTLRITTVVLSTLAMLVLFGLVGFQALIVGHQSRIDDLDDQITEAARVNQRLRVNVASMESPERIRVAALTMLGMIEPEVVTYLEPIPAHELVPPSESDS